jgi:hypothetical protein
VQPHDLGHVPINEIRLKTQANVLWVAIALLVTTCLWVSGAVSPTRDRSLIQRLVTVMTACASFGPLLFMTYGLKTYIDIMRCAFRTRQISAGGRSRLIG